VLALRFPDMTLPSILLGLHEPFPCSFYEIASNYYFCFNFLEYLDLLWSLPVMVALFVVWFGVWWQDELAALTCSWQLNTNEAHAVSLRQVASHWPMMPSPLHRTVLRSPRSSSTHLTPRPRYTHQLFSALPTSTPEKHTLGLLARSGRD